MFYQQNINLGVELILSLYSLLDSVAKSSPKASALLAPSRKSLTYGELLHQIEQTVSALNALGIGRGDRVAMVLPNGPEMAVCCLSAASAATSAPLNPAYSAAEFEFYLSDLKPKAVIVESGSDSPVVALASSAGIPLIRLVCNRDEPAGIFRLDGAVAGKRPCDPGLAGPEDVALLLHTSGSTSRPKMVPLTHANLCTSAGNIRASLALTARDRCLNIMPLFHIHGLIGAILSSLAAGASVVCTPGLHALSFAGWLDEFQPTWYTAVPTMHQAILARMEQKPEVISRSRLRFIRSSSSALPPRLMADMERVFRVPVVEAYGMTEASHQMAINPLPPRERKPGSVGLPAGCEIAIMDGDGSFLPPARIGEVAIRGANVTSGYDNNPVANESSFAGGWFRTGDQGRLDADGFLFLTGRSKEIINRGGEKISPREVDEALLEHPAVAQAMAFSFPDERLGEDVGAAVVLREGQTAIESLNALREFAAQRLADFKVPRKIVLVKEIPKGPTGKPQRIGLAAKLGLLEETRATPQDRQPFTLPDTDTERRLAVLWQDVLGLDRLGIHDDFFQLGGDSLLAAQLIVRVRDEFGAELPMFRLFGAPSIRSLAEWVDSAPRSAAAATGPIPRVPRDGVLPLSFAQQRIWFLAQFEEEGPAYVVPTALRLQGPVSVNALEASLQSIVDRHEILRTRYSSSDGVPVQDIAPEYRLSLPVIGMEQVADSEKESRLHQLAREEVRRRFDLSRDFPLRATLVRLREDDHVLILTLHHIAFDGWSRSVFFRELENFYGAFVAESQPAVEDLSVQYADYASWRLRQLEGETGDRLSAYWKQRLAGTPALLELPNDRPRPARQTFRGALERRRLPKGLGDALRSLSRSESVTLFMTLLAAFQTLLSRYSGQTDICVGSPTAYRIRKEIEGLIGFFVNTLAMRTDLSGHPTFRQLLARVRETALGAYDHQDLPFERLIEVVQPERSLSHSPLFQAMFQLRNFPEIVTNLDGLRVSPVELDPGTAQLDLALEITESDQGLMCVLNYNNDLFDAATARRMLLHYQTLLEAAVRDPDVAISRLPMLTEAEQRQLLVEWNQTGAEFPRACVHELFEDQAGKTPGSIAASCENRRWTYAELNQRAGSVARHLRNVGIGPGDLVGICVERSLEMLAALLGIWKAGAAYVPLDPAYPKERLSFILQDAGAAVLLTERNLRDRFQIFEMRVALLEDCWDHSRLGSEPPASNRATVEDLAYVIYTSGSTGSPKGVAIRHRSLTNLLVAMQSRLAPTPRDVLLALTTISFDIAGVELFLPLIVGARVVIVPSAVASDGGRLARAIRKSGATIVQSTPATWQLLLETGWTGEPGLKIVCGGEALPQALADQLVERGSVWNAYGPTETTIWSTVAILGAKLSSGPAFPPIGRPLANTEVYVLDSNQQLVPVGVPGELHIGGEGLAREYWNRPGLTAERFIPNPLRAGPGSRLYRTGDLVRYLPDGNLEFVRRIDDQVKLRGFRIELGEVEATLRQHPSVRAAAVRLIEAGPGDKRLVAYFVSHQANAPGETDFREFLRQRLPAYMVPSSFVCLESLPLTPNGKVDRNALAVPDTSRRRQQDRASAPSDSIETMLLQIWEDVLRRQPIGVDDNFFELGGHSLLGARLLGRIEKAFGRRLTLVSFFEAPTVARMAALLREGGTGIAHSRVIAIRSSGSRPPLYLLHPHPLFRPLMLRLPEEQPVLAISVFEPSALRVPIRLEDIAVHQIKALRDFQPQGPYLLAGWSADGVLAYEMARQLRAQGQSVPLLVMFDSFNPASLRNQPGRMIRMDRLKFHLVSLWRLDAKQAIAYAGERVRTLTERMRARSWRASYKLHLLVDRRMDHLLRKADQVLRHSVLEYCPGPYEGSVLVVRAQIRPAGTYADAGFGWRNLVPDLEVVEVPGNHRDMLAEPNVEMLANALNDRFSALC